jgi:hypothetical protein
MTTNKTTETPRIDTLFGGIMIGLTIAVAAFAIFTGGFDRCLQLGPTGNKALICGFRL